MPRNNNKKLSILPHKPEQIMRKDLLVLSLAFTMTACSGYGDSDNPPTVSSGPDTVSRTGLYIGTITYAAAPGSPLNQVTLIDKNNEMVLVDEGLNLMHSIVFPYEDTSLSGAFAFFEAGKDPADDSIKGNLTGSHSSTDLTGFAEVGGATAAAFSMTYNAIFERGAALDTVAGNYLLSGIATIAIDNLGNLTFNRADGCQLLGTVAIPDPVQNLYTTSGVMSNCGDANGNYSGYITLIDTTVPNDTLVYAIYGDSSGGNPESGMGAFFDRI